MSPSQIRAFWIFDREVLKAAFVYPGYSAVVLMSRALTAPDRQRRCLGATSCSTPAWATGREASARTSRMRSTARLQMSSAPFGTRTPAATDQPIARLSREPQEGRVSPLG